MILCVGKLEITELKSCVFCNNLVLLMHFLRKLIRLTDLTTLNQASFQTVELRWILDIHTMVELTPCFLK